MKQILLPILLFFFVISCKDNLDFTFKKYEKISERSCTDSCPKATITVPFFKKGSFVSDSINHKIFNTIKDIVYFGEEPYQSMDYEELLNSFMNSYEEMKADFPDESIGWEATIIGDIRYQSDHLINIGISSYLYTGGAHGYGSLTSLLFDKKTGIAITNKELFNNEKSFIAYAEKKFRKEQNIPDNLSINTTGLLFDNDEFKLPDNIFFTDQGLVLYFYTYDIASYTDGPQELILPYSEVDPYLKIK